MNVIAAKSTQFTPVVLYLPGHEEVKGPVLNKNIEKPITVSPTNEPELWKIYRRLAKTPKPERSVKAKENCGMAPPALNIPGKDGMKCMCYENLMRLIKDQAQIPPPQLFRCSHNKTPQTKIDDIFPTWTRKAIMGFRCNEELQFPLSTLIVRWQLKRTIPSYDMYTLRYIFSRYGRLRDIRKLSPNSCLVIFDELTAACQVMQSRYLGDQVNKLHCTWWHRSMANKIVCFNAKGLRVKTDYYKL